MPELLRPGLLYAVVALAAGAGSLAWYAFRRGVRRGCIVALTVAAGLMGLFLSLHAQQLSNMEFSPQANAYGSVFFVLSWAMDVLVLIGLGMAGTALVRAWREREHWRTFLALHMQMTVHFSYFTAAMAIIVYGTLYLSPYAI